MKMPFPFHRVLIVLLMLLSVLAFPQEPFVKRIRFTLPGREPVFHTALQDRSGFLWLASPDGLFRFDGIAFREYSHNEAQLSDITALGQDGNGTLWIGRKNGSILHLAGDRITEFTPEEGTAGAAVSGFLTSIPGEIWWSTHGEGIYRYAGGRVFNINRDDGLGDDYVYDMDLDEEGRIIAATDNGISMIRMDGDLKQLSRPEVNDSLPDIIVKSLAVDGSGRLWMGFQDAGAVLASAGNAVPARGPGNWAHGPVEDLALAGKTAWAATSSSGIFEVFPNGSARPLFKDDNTGESRFGRIYQLLPDREENIWVLSSNGLFRTTGGKLGRLSVTQREEQQTVHAVMRDSYGDLWYSIDEGIFRHNIAKDETKKYLERYSNGNVKFMSIREDNYGMIWTGTFDHGLFRINPEEGSSRRITENDGLVNNNVLSISIHNDTLWAATLGGATRIILTGPSLNAPMEMTSFGKQEGLGNSFIYDVYEDRQDRVWFATDGDGISMWSNGCFVSYGKSSGLKDDVIYSVAGDRDGNIWFSTANEGIYRFDGKNFTNFGTEAGLRSLEISALDVIGDEVVIVHGLGIDVLHLPELTVVPFGVAAGLEGIEPELNSIQVDEEGCAWIGTNRGILRYSPSHEVAAPRPLTRLESMTVMLQPWPMEQGATLRSRQDHVGFAYEGVWLSDPERVLYKVYLEGYDLDWKDTYDRQAIYSSLGPGSYFFHVKSALDPSFQNASEASFAFTIKRPVWQQAWFIALAILLAASAVYAYILFRERKLKAIEQQKKEKIEFEFQLLKNQVNPHFLFNSFSTLISLIEENREQAAEYTEKLSDFFRRILQLKDNPVITLKEELELIRDYLFIQGKRYGDLIRLDMRLDDDVLGSAIPPMTLQMLMENAVKHNVISRDRPLLIRIFVEGDRLVVENSYQPKRNAETSTGIGLENISRRYRILCGQEVVTEIFGDMFRVKLPLM